MTGTLRKVVFPVAGLGTRFLPATKVTPKEMLPIVDRPLIQYAVDEALDAGADTLIFIISQKKHAISDYFDRANELESHLDAKQKHETVEELKALVPDHVARVYVTQTEQLGLGHAVACAASVVGNEPFGVVLPDDLIYADGRSCLGQLADVHAESGASVLAVEQVPRQLTSSYGIVDTDGEREKTSRVKGIVEKPDPEKAPSTLAVVGRYILSGRVMRLLRSTRPGAGGEIQLTDAIAELMQKESVLAHRFDGLRFDCGSKLGFVEATVHHALQDADIGPQFLEYLKHFVSRVA